MRHPRITANLPGRIEGSVRRQVKAERYPSESAYGVGLILWDIYTRQQHNLTGPLLREPRWVIDGYVFKMLQERGEEPGPPGEPKPYRMTIHVPPVLWPATATRIEEERYKSGSAYATGLVVFDLKVNGEKRVAHHKTAALMREPDWVREAVIAQLVSDFGNPARKWPNGIDGRIDELMERQRQLPLKT